MLSLLYYYYPLAKVPSDASRRLHAPDSSVVKDYSSRFARQKGTRGGLAGGCIRATRSVTSDASNVLSEKDTRRRRFAKAVV